MVYCALNTIALSYKMEEKYYATVCDTMENQINVSVAWQKRREVFSESQILFTVLCFEIVHISDNGIFHRSFAG